MTTNIYDSAYKKLLSNHTIFRQLIRTFIKQDWVDELDFDQCETLDKSFISDNYKKTESDLIYKVKVRGKTIYIYVLLEFQSSVDRFMVVRVLNYITNFYLDYVATHRRIKKLPAIFPVVLYNGKKKWTAVQEIADLIESEPALGQYALHFQYLLINEKGYSRQQLLKIRNIVSTLFLAEAHYDIKLLETELLNLYEREEDKEAVSLFLNWFKQLVLYGKVSPEDYGQLDYVYRTKEEVQTMLAATLEQERKKIYQRGEAAGLAKGEAAGLAKGEAAGLAKGRVQTIGELLHFRFELEEAEQAKYTQQVARIEELPHLDELVNILLNKATTLENFTNLLTKYLPADKAA